MTSDGSDDSAYWLEKLASTKPTDRARACIALGIKPVGDRRLLEACERLLDDRAIALLGTPYSFGEVRWVAGEAVAALRGLFGIREPVVIADGFAPVSANNAIKLIDAAGVRTTGGGGNDGIIGALEQLAKAGKLPRRKITYTPEVSPAVGARVVDRAELRVLLEKYFVGPIDDATVERLDRQLAALKADPRKDAAESAAYNGNKDRYHGQAWKELLATGAGAPTDAQLAVWLAVVTQGYPKARPYCPDVFVGTWRQIKPRAARWQLGADGAFATDEPHVAKYTRWCVRHFESNRTFELDTLFLLDDADNKSSNMIVTVEPDRVVIKRSRTSDGDVDFDLERVR